MKNLSIEVSSIANLVDNPDFSRWNQNYPTSWTVNEVIDGGTVEPYPFEDGFACGVVGIDSSTETHLTQEIGTLTTGDNYTISFMFMGKGTVSVEDNDGGWAVVSNSGIDFRTEIWRSFEINFTIESSTPHRVKIQPAYDSSDPEFNYCYINVVNIYKSDWYSDKKPLMIEEISAIENLSRAIEDDIFTFMSDSIELEVYNYEEVTGYFTPSDFLTNSQRIFRFDITFDYDTVTKEIILFSNNDTIKRVQRPASDVIKLSLYELPTLFNDNGWFLGELTRHIDDDGDPTDEGYYQYFSHEEGSSVYNANVPIATVVSELQSDIINLMKQRAIPVRDEDFSIINNLSGNSEFINIHFNDLIGIGGDEYFLLDMIVTPTYRTFLLLVRNNLINEDLGDNDIKIWELVNGTTPVETDLGVPVINSNDNALGTDGGLLVGFIHSYSGATHYSYENDSDINGKEIEFAIIRISHQSEPSNHTTKIWAYSNNASTNSNSDFDLVRAGDRLYEQNGLPESIALQQKCTIINEYGWIDYEVPYDSTTDNMLWISQHPIFPNNTTSAVYTANDFIIKDVSGGQMWDFSYARSLSSKLYRFQQYYSFRFNNATPSDVLKELAITQDAVWYLEYSDSNMAINIYTRDTTESIDYNWDDTEWTMKDQYVKMLKFDDLNSQLFNEDFNRMRDLIGYYNYKYGRGRTEIEATKWGYYDYGLRDLVRFEDKTYFIKQVELENYDYATNFRIFEIWQ